MICAPRPTRRLRHYRLNRASPTAKALAAWWPGKHPGGETLDDAAGINTGTFSGTGARWASDGERQGIVPSFNGTNDYVTVSRAEMILSEMSYMFWFITSASALQQPCGLSSDNWVPHTALPEGGGLKARIFLQNTLGSAAGLDTSIKINDGVWHHLAVVFDATAANDYTLYLDGCVDGQNDFGWDGVKLFPGGLGRFGCRLSPAYYFNGRLDDPRVYTRALSAAEIRHIYDCGRVAPLSDLAEPVGREGFATIPAVETPDIIAGPYYVEAGALYSTGPAAGKHYTPGPAAGALYTPGPARGRIRDA